MFLVIKGRVGMEFRDVRCGWRKVNSSLCRAASSTVLLPRKKRTLLFEPARFSTRAT